MISIHHGDNLSFLKTLPHSSINLIYIDPPFNTGKAQTMRRMSKGQLVGTMSYGADTDTWHQDLHERLNEAYRILAANGSLFLHLDYREVHYAKVWLDGLFGRDNFMNEIIWSYDYGARQKNKWSTKHDNILWYVNDPNDYCFNYEEIDRIPYMAPGLVGAEKAERGKTPTDVWWNTIVPTNGPERTGYPTQKPLGILERIVRVHSKVGDNLLDFYAGSGSFGEAAAKHGRNVTLVDENPQAIEVMRKRFERYNYKEI